MTLACEVNVMANNVTATIDKVTTEVRDNQWTALHIDVTIRNSSDEGAIIFLKDTHNYSRHFVLTDVRNEEIVGNTNVMIPLSSQNSPRMRGLPGNSDLQLRMTVFYKEDVITAGLHHYDVDKSKTYGIQFACGALFIGSENCNNVLCINKVYVDLPDL